MLCASVTSLPGATGLAQGVSVSFRASNERTAPLEVNFTATVPSGARVTWDFGDGTTTTGTAPSHTFWRPGTYRVTVGVEAGSARYSGALTVEVRDGGPEAAQITLLHGGDRVGFSAHASRVYGPATPRWFLDGRPVGVQNTPLPDGPHVLRLELPGPSGVLTREVRFTTGKLGGSVAFEAEVLRLTNDARARGWDCALKRFGGPGKPPLTRDGTLDVAARAQSAAMAFHGYFDHDSPLDGSAAGARARAAGYRWSLVAENIAGGQTTPAEVVDGWLRSPGHCRNIMGDFRHLGVSYVSRPGSELRTYWTQVFGRP